jgi:hypothetical protein
MAWLFCIILCLLHAAKASLNQGWVLLACSADSIAIAILKAILYFKARDAKLISDHEIAIMLAENLGSSLLEMLL